MGLLSAGEPLTWEETKKLADFIKEHGIQQFINVYHRHRLIKRDCLRWGDEIEYLLVKFDKVNKKVQVNLRGSELLPILSKNNVNKSDWKPEYADYMLEGTPFLPYGGQSRDFTMVEENMASRRRSIEELLGDDEAVITIPAFPRIGLPGFTFPIIKPTPENSASGSLFYPDRAIFPQHPRFALLTNNIRRRRGRKIAINIPIFKDEKTEEPFFVEDPEKFYDEEAKGAAKPNHVYMDAMGFGMGLCCLQVTFQAVDVDEARYLYDQLANICPLMMALTAGTPVLRGVLTATDTRWQVISAAVDDRTLEESGQMPLKVSRFQFPKSRYDSIDSYLSPLGAPFSDLTPFPVEPGFMAKLTESGVDCVLARHIAHLFCRDPLTAYREKMFQNDAIDTDHFENIQSTNWQTLRFKPPPSQPQLDPLNSSTCSPVPDPTKVARIGWRVEFRPMEIQITDFENAALTVFVVLLTRVILTFRLNFVIPISRVDENLRRAHLMDSVSTQKFFFRTNVFTDSSPPEARQCCGAQSGEQRSRAKSIPCCTPEEVRIANENCRFVELTIDQIVNGCEEFPGVVPLCISYLDTLGCDVETRRKVSVYLDLISGRATGRFKTNARWMRDFITSHPDYRKDSRVSDEIQFDMLERILAISRNQTIDSTLIPAGAYFQRQPSSRNGSCNVSRTTSVTNPNGNVNNNNNGLAPPSPTSTCNDTLTPEQQDELLEQLINGLS